MVELRVPYSVTQRSIPIVRQLSAIEIDVQVAPYPEIHVIWNPIEGMLRQPIMRPILRFAGIRAIAAVAPCLRRNCKGGGREYDKANQNFDRERPAFYGGFLCTFRVGRKGLRNIKIAAATSAKIVMAASTYTLSTNSS